MNADRDISLRVLDRMRIASPCAASWASMTGDDRSRFCNQCNKYVYNFAAMTAGDIHALIIEKEGRLCGRLHRRADGTVLTADCPVGRGIVRRKAARVAAFAAAMLLVALQTMAYVLPANRRACLREFEPFAAICKRLTPQTATPPIMLMGSVAWSPPTATPAPTGQ